MKKILIIISILLFFQSANSQNDHLSFIDKVPEVGVYYYPEHWPEDQWERDIKKMADLGFKFTHFGEFAWAKLEPQEGKYDFAWLDKVLTLCEKHGLKVIMCTPSPTIPAWLSHKYPEVLAMKEDGERLQHNGSRLTGSLSNPIYQKYVEKIVTVLAQKYGKDKRIIGWQIGNEPHIEIMYDYSLSATIAFREWLKNKYKSIEELNRSWGASFWSFTFNDFDQIMCPKASHTNPNPHAMLDFQRFTSHEVANDLIRQAQIIKKYKSNDQYVTTNFAYFKFLPNVDPFLTKNELDFASHTMYLTSRWLNDSGDPLAHRLGSGMELSFSEEFAQSVNGITGIMEIQPGQINWGKINAMPLPGAVRMWLWHSFGLGDSFFCAYRFRQPLFGSEQTHHGIMMTDGITVNRGGEEFVTFMKELEQVKKQFDVNAKMPKDYASRNTAFLWNYDNLLDMQNHKHHEDWDSWQHMYTYYENLKTLGCPVTFLSEGDEFDAKKYPFMVAPAYQLVDQNLINKWKEYIASGGHLVLTTRTGLKDKNGHIWETKLQQPIWDLIGSEIEYYDHLPSSFPGQINYEGKKYPWHVWGTIMSLKKGTETWAVFDDQFYVNKPAIIHNPVGKGSVTYIGALSDNKELERLILRKLYQSKGATILDLPRYVFTEWRDGLWITVNYTANSVPAPVHQNSQILIGSKELQPARVVVWSNNKN